MTATNASTEPDPEDFMPAAREACPGPPHDKPEDPWDYPCWECRLDAYFAAEEPGEGRG